MIYLDNAATTPMHPEVLAVMLPYLSEDFGNAGTIYNIGRRAADAIVTARKQVADFIGAKHEEIIFTSGGTESNNLAILGVKNYLERIGKKHIITSPVEHDSVLKAVDMLCNQLQCNTKKCIKDGFHISLLPVDKYGHADSDELDKMIHSFNDIGLVSLMCVNNELGVKNDIETMAHECKMHNILFHTDCVQAAATTLIDVNKLDCDFISISSHKLHGPKGIGALYVRDKNVVSAIINGGSLQEFGLRGGTENVAAIVGFGRACELSNLLYTKNIVSSYRRNFYEQVKNKLDNYKLGDSMILNGLLPRYDGRILSLTFKGIDAETLVLMMDSKGVCISAGSACQGHEPTPSHVLTAIGLSDNEARSTVRISFSEFNTPEELDKAANILVGCIKTLRGV